MHVSLLSLIAVLSHKRTLDLIMSQVRVQIILNLTMSEDMACRWQPSHVRESRTSSASGGLNSVFFSFLSVV